MELQGLKRAAPWGVLVAITALSFWFLVSIPSTWVASDASVEAPAVEIEGVDLRQFDTAGQVGLEPFIVYGVDGDVLLDGAFIDDARVSEASSVEYYYQETTYTALWELFTALVPSGWRDHVVRFEGGTDGVGDYWAETYQADTAMDEWVLGVDVIDVHQGDLLDQDQLIATLIHEFAHLLSVREGQLVYDQALYETYYQSELEAERARKLPACLPNYLFNEGCAVSEGYMNLFYQQFWTGAYAEAYNRISAEAGTRAHERALAQLYEVYEYDFWNGYAASHPEEDFAESFTQFIVNDEFAPEFITGEEEVVWEQKVIFFYRFPELVALRDEIRERIQMNTENTP